MAIIQLIKQKFGDVEYTIVERDQTCIERVMLQLMRSEALKIQSSGLDDPDPVDPSVVAILTRDKFAV
tara:strand:+ start:322 stop:525 length:204 start_codon:yes stop_codon:yes gene_type:complete